MASAVDALSDRLEGAEPLQQSQPAATAHATERAAVETAITLEPSAYRRDRLPARASELRIGVFAPPLVEPFQPSLTLPYLAAQLQSLGLPSACHNLSSLFYIWLFRRLRLESMQRYHSLGDAIAVLRDPVRFYEPESYHAALECLEEYVLALAGRDRLPYSLYPASRASAVADRDNYRELVGAMPGTLLERFLRDYVGFTLRLDAYDVIGFSATNAFQLASSLYIARLLKQAGIPAHLIVGGHAVSVAGPALFDDQELTGCIDSVVFGGGADVFATVCDHLVAGKARRRYTSIDATTPLDDRGGLFPTETPYRIVLQHDINDLYLSPHQVFSIYSALGCSYGACTFCGSNRIMAPYVARTIPVLVDEMEQLQQNYGISHFDICDNNFDPIRASAFCDELERRGRRFWWQCTSRVYTTLTEPLLRRMRRAGCVLMNIGLESASDRILRLMRKGYTAEHVEELLLSTEAAGMPVHLYCICSFPSETTAESETTLNFLRRHLDRCHSVYFQDYEAQLASQVFAGELGTYTEGHSAARMIAALLAEPAVSAKYVANGNLVRKRGYPFIEGHNFLYLAHENGQPAGPGAAARPLTSLPLAGT